MNKKLTLTLGTVAAIAAPVLAVVSCGDDATNNTGGNLGVNHNTSTNKPGNKAPTTLTIQAEAGWKSTYASVIAEFKKTHAPLLAANNITDIHTIEIGSFDTVTNIKNNDQFNEDKVADIFLVASDGMDDALSTRALQPYNLTRFSTTPTTMSETPAAEFMKLHGNGDSFLDQAFATAMTGVRTIGSKRGNTYGLPANVESMVAFNQQGATNTKVLTQFANLWMSAGFFNTATKNMKDIVSTNPANGQIVGPNVQEWTPFIKAGFKKIATKIKELQIEAQEAFNQDMLDKEATKSDAAILNYVSKHQNKISLLDGPWNAGKMATAFGNYEAKPAPSDWNQWGGGWNICLNSRMIGAEQTVAEEFIAYLLSGQNAKTLLSGAGKISPTTNGKTQLTSQAFMATNTIPDAVYKTTVQEKPTGSAFGNVGWTSYAETVHEFRKDDGNTRGWSLSDLRSQSDLDVVATAMASEYFKRLDATIVAKNSASTS